MSHQFLEGREDVGESEGYQKEFVVPVMSLNLVFDISLVASLLGNNHSVNPYLKNI